MQPVRTLKALIACFALLVFCFTCQAQSGSVETVQFHSTLINATLPYKVVLPADYRTSRTTRYPVLYLLHGLTGHYSDWLTRTNVADYAAQYRLIVVTPEGNDGWYTDSATKPNDKYETYVLKELIPDVQRRFRTIETRHGRAIAGLSMGGYGALKFGLKSPGTFIFAGSMSGCPEAASWTVDDLKGLKWIYDSLPPVFGPAESETRKANDLLEIVRGMTATSIGALPYLYLDCGTEDFASNSNQKFAELLRQKKVPHEYRQLPGNHNWQYWDQQVKEVLKIAAEKLKASSGGSYHPRQRSQYHPRQRME
jgi:putative tributyrin esterase